MGGFGIDRYITMVLERGMNVVLGQQFCVEGLRQMAATTSFQFLLALSFLHKLSGFQDQFGKYTKHEFRLQ